MVHELFIAKNYIIVYISNYYRSIKDLITLNIKSIEKYLLYFITFFFVCNIYRITRDLRAYNEPRILRVLIREIKGPLML
jgi:hypothetical protein